MRLFKRKCRHDWKNCWYGFDEFRKHFPITGYKRCQKCGKTKNFRPLCVIDDDA